MLQQNKIRGFTLVELMVVIALVAIIAAFAVPMMGRVIDNNRIISTTNSVVGLLNYSRSEAVRRGASVTVTANNDSLVATLASDASTIRVIEPAAGGIDITDGAVTFLTTGLTNGSQNFTICSGDATGRQVAVSLGGRVETTETACP